MMDDLISRQAAINVVEEYLEQHRKYIGTPEDNEANALARGLLISIEMGIERLPAEVEPVKRGKWIYDNQFHWYRASCSECGYKRVADIKAEKWNGWKYCPNCGAKMEGEEE